MAHSTPCSSPAFPTAELPADSRKLMSRVPKNITLLSGNVKSHHISVTPLLPLSHSNPPKVLRIPPELALPKVFVCPNHIARPCLVETSYKDIASKITTFVNFSLKLFTAALYFLNGYILYVPKLLSFTEK